MRKVLLSVVMLSFFSVAHAGTGENQLFDCMDAKTFEMNNQCMSDKISSNIRFREAQTELNSVANESLGDYAIATMTFDQEKMQIDVVAHREALLARLARLN